ncbi:MAG TPA: cytochrome c biogenesis protein CcdA [Candidatus Scybalomonas excrementigallinarum]|nr:cytochrome c biogenesis protein CcdA [Candidatus Scybalomonas excrementigallinarum]
MRYLLLFLEGIITFISPCILPMLPIYISYFAGSEGNQKFRAFRNAIAFVLGFTIIFSLMGAAASTVGVFFQQHMKIINLICGIVMIVFGINLLGLYPIKVLNNTYKISWNKDTKNMGIVGSFIFGSIFGIGWTPCVGPFLGSALMIASNSTKIVEGVLMLVVYSLGLGIPFILSALLIHLLAGVFQFIKAHYSIIKGISGALLIVIGICMATGYLNVFLSLLTF